MDNNKNLLISIATLISIVIVIPIMASCSKSNTVNPNATSVVNLEVINAGPDVLPINLFVNYAQQTTSPIYFPSGSGYIGMPSVDTPVQIRTAETSGATLLTVSNSLQLNVRYTVFVTGLVADNSLAYIFTADTATIPTIGRGKVRFVNASPRTIGLDLYANGTLAFTNQAFKAVTPYIELPAGNYNFQIYNTGNSTSVLASLPATTVQDGGLYTIYTYGLVGQTDTLAFGAALLNNNP